ncbi:tRNA lysidine(34) synthetase TilS [Deinococcus sp.]|uniref:tRNA lysidine(34) synthetase TilS n=1 Tax=Deinococcus sp. TaxID=47478 RepID=UPI0025D9C83B|nr:tRNA lysidine(34) synthetase TilS [Deinococcus sp.]
MSDPLTPLLAPLRVYAATDVVVGVSGGADSVALLRGLLAVGARPVVAHLDHQLRPESGADARWVAERCAELGVPCELGAAPVAQVAARRGWSTEEAARRLRYDFLSRVARQHGVRLILTAHTRRDQAETVLWQLLRGEAVLHGIPAQRGPLRRPWLGVSRVQVEAALSHWAQAWREDASNSETRYTRNWLRLEVLPLLAERFPGLEESLSRLARFQASDDSALSDLTARLTPHTPLARQPDAVLRRFVRRALQGAELTFHAEHLDHLAGALGEGRATRQTLPGGAQASVTGGAFSQLHLPRPDLPRPVPDGPRPTFAPPESWTLRRREPGDRIRLSGGTRSLSDVLGELRLTLEARENLWLLASSDGVQWVGTAPPIWAVNARNQVPDYDERLNDPDHFWMGQALAQARAAAEAGEVPVGAVLVRGGELIAAAANRSRAANDMTRHAELEALRAGAAVVGPYLSGCTLYVTLEPCPMCLGALTLARVGRVVYGASNPRAGALGGVSDLLSANWGHRLEVTPGVRAGEAARLLRRSFAGFRQAADARGECIQGEGTEGEGTEGG